MICFFKPKNRTLTKKYEKMKKLLLVIIIMLLICFGAEAQTYQKARENLDSRIKKLEQLKNKKGTTEKEKSMIDSTLLILKDLSLFGDEIYSKKELSRGINLDVPKEMSRREYNRRYRSLMYQTSEKIIQQSDSIQNQGFKGLLVNYKTGPNELAIFTIARTDVKGLSPAVISLNPKERLPWSLLPGNYQVLIVCGDYRAIRYFQVNPENIKYFDGQPVYWFAAKTMSDF